jgi:formylglycine-generating enzyme required for sulfatase activity
VGLDRGRLELDLNGKGSTMSVPFKDKVPAEEIVKFFEAKPEMAQEEAARAKAAFYIAIQDLANAENAAKAVEENERVRYLVGVEMIRKGRDAVLREQAEGEAEKCAKQIEDLDKQGKPKEACAQIEEGMKRFKDTKAFASREALFEQIKDKVSCRTSVEMVKVEGGPFRAGFRKEEQTVATFYIDKQKVSNKEYRKFVMWLLNESNRDETTKFLAAFEAKENREGKYRIPQDPIEFIPRYFTEFEEIQERKARDSSRADAMEQWKRFSAELQIARDRYSGDDRTVVDVSWFAAEAYAMWVGKRLPTYEEWEKAARGASGALNMVALTAEWVDQPGLARVGVGKSGTNAFTLDADGSELHMTPYNRNFSCGFRCARSAK